MPDPDLEQTSLTSIAIVSLVSTAIFAVFVYAFAFLGRDWIHELDIGENLARHAREHVSVGELEVAVNYYNEALLLTFSDPRQRGYTLRELGELLIDLDRLQEAALQLSEAVNDFPSDNKARLSLAKALSLAEDWPSLVNKSTEWREYAIRAGLPSEIGIASYNLGRAYEEMGQLEDAMEAYRFGHESAPSSANGFHYGMLLAEIGRTKEAQEVLTTYIVHGEGWRLNRARKWMAEVAREIQ